MSFTILPMVSEQNRYILAIDHGTSGCKASIWDSAGNPVYIQTNPVRRYTPASGYVEQDPEEMWRAQLEVIKQVISETGISYSDIAGIGITNQRETVIAWDSTTGKPLYNAISWLDRRTGNSPLDTSAGDLRSLIKDKTGLIPDPYFSATKMQWITEEMKRRHDHAHTDNMIFGTVDSWLIWKLTNGKRHVTDWSNASRTMLFNIGKGSWDSSLLEMYGIDEHTLPEVVDSINPEITTDSSIFGCEIPVGGVAGDQQASLFGHLALSKGDMKSTYGTGSFLLINAGSEVPATENLISTVAWKEHSRPPVYAIEGSSFNTGSLLDWIRDRLKMIENSAQSEELALSSIPNHGVYFVPALTGLGAPYWNSKAKGAIFGITTRVSNAEIVKSALESIAYRIRDMVEAARSEAGIMPNLMRVDGKPCSNNFLMQFQADILGMPIQRLRNREATSAGVAYMAGIAEGLSDASSLADSNPVEMEFSPSLSEEEGNRLYNGWKKAVNTVLSMYD